MADFFLYHYKVKNVIIDSSIEVISIAMNGRIALTRSSFRFTFNPNPTIAIVNRRVVKLDTAFKIVGGT